MDDTRRQKRKSRHLLSTEKCLYCGCEIEVYQTRAGVQSDGDILMNLPGIACSDCSCDPAHKADPKACVGVLTPAIVASALNTGEFHRPIEEAAQFFIRLFPTDSQVIATGAVRMHVAGLQQAAVMLIEDRLEECDDPVRLMINLAAMHGMNGEPARGLQILEQVPNTTARYHAIRGNLLKDTGDWEGAADSWREAIRTAPNDEVAWQNLGYYLTHIVEDYDAAEEHFLQAINLFPKSRHFLAGLGDVYYGQGRIPDAYEAHYQARMPEPDLAEHCDFDLDRFIDDIKNGKLD